MSERIIDEYATWRFAGFENVERAADNNRGDAVGFKVSRYQTPGLMAHGSHRYQENGVHRLRLKLRAQLWDQLFAYAPLRVDAAHTRK